MTSQSGKPGSYVVVARRYRPQTFEDLVGQEHVARAMSNAIGTGRVGHAYLFTGARGVGKTSAARILAKALNCVKGPAAVPCNQCDICQAISGGDDVDVLEIDGASNRGIDEIRQLRQNVNVRPSRERFKIYIIDEVHMLTREAFNALLKTLEEPPAHVKFIFCTTEPGKIPITILSRCQRFDFAGIQTESIARRLAQIVAAESVSAEPEALDLLARRATGSMRDSQSLLEQLLAFAPEHITVADVNNMLGAAGEQRLLELLGYLVGRDAAGALALLDATSAEGIDPGQLLEQVLGVLRDCMVAAVGGEGNLLLYSTPRALPQIQAAGRRFGLDGILAAMQILDQTLGRLRVSTQGRILAELTLVRICQLEELAELPALIAAIRSGGMLGGLSESVATGPRMTAPREATAAGASPLGALPGPGQGPGPGPVSPTPPGPGSGSDSKKNIESSQASPGMTPPTADVPALSGAVALSDGVPTCDDSAQRSSSHHPSVAVLPLSEENATEIWSRVVAKTTGLAAEHAKNYARAAISGPNRLVVVFKAGYTLSRSVCEKADQKAKFEQLLAELTGQRVQLEFAVAEPDEGAPQAGAARAAPPQQRLLEVGKNPMVRRATELFGAYPTRVDDSKASE